MKKKLLIIAAGNNFSFIHDIGMALQSEFDVGFWRHPIEGGDNSLYKLIKAADVVWLEWADGISLSVLNSYTAKFILRIHRYELFQPRTLEAISHIDPNKVAKLLFVGFYIQSIGMTKFPWMEKGIVIPNLIDVDRFPLCEKEEGRNLLFLGRVSYVKNLPLLLNFFQMLPQAWGYRLHIVGNISNPELEYYQDNFLRKTDMERLVTFHGRIQHDLLPEFMRDMHYIISTSIFESQGVGVLEAMSTGLKPVVYSFGGAENFFPEKYLFITGSNFQYRLSPTHYYTPREYRDFVVEKYSIQNNLWRYAEVIREVADG